MPALAKIKFRRTLSHTSTMALVSVIVRPKFDVPNDASYPDSKTALSLVSSIPPILYLLIYYRSSTNNHVQRQRAACGRHNELMISCGWLRDLPERISTTRDSYGNTGNIEECHTIVALLQLNHLAKSGWRQSGIRCCPLTSYVNR